MSTDDVRYRQEELRDRRRQDNSAVVAPVHKIAEQFYCEKKVDLALMHGDRANQQTTAGSEGHETATEFSTAVSRDDFWEDVAAGGVTRYGEIGFHTELNGVYIAGQSDLVEFRDGMPTAVVERKFTPSGNRLYPDEEFQAWVYSHILNQIGFDSQNLRYAVLKLPRELKLSPEILREVDMMVLDEMAQSSVTGHHQPVDDFPVHAHIYDYQLTGRFASPYEDRSFLEGLSWALEYWREERPPEPTTIPQKCRSCDYKVECPDSKV